MGLAARGRQKTALVTNQASGLDVQSGGGFRVDVGWSEVEFVGLNEDWGPDQPMTCTAVGSISKMTLTSPGLL